MACDLVPSRFIFQHDNDHEHTSKNVRQWLGSGKKSYVLSWPAQSHDINPIEHLWAWLKHSLNQYQGAPTRLLELWECIEECWASMTLL